ncbi:MAG TPA: alpha/beta hydrolase [Acidimicrobiales bacterium]|jgi:lipase|nr:alpha/beta hydrolase [Acidimicrobiales bacterium]
MSGALYETISVPVDGGDLVVGVWGPPQAPVVLAPHGITGNHLHMAFLARHLPDLRVVAPDLRGRGGSALLPGPWGMVNHARDLVAILDHLGVDQAPVVGHSMGAFVAVQVAAEHPERVPRIVLIDGGLALQVPAGVDVDAMIEAVIGPAMQRLRTTFGSVDSYRDFWKQHPAFANDWSDIVQAAVDYDLVGDPGELHSSVSLDAVRADGGDALVDDRVKTALARTRCPIHLLWAERGMLDQEPGLYVDEMIAPFRDLLGERFTDERVAGVNHYTIGLSDRGAARVAAAIGC